MKEIRGSIEINAPVGMVWNTITDFGSYPKWNPWIILMEGDQQVGGRLNGIIRVQGRKDTKLSSSVLKAEKDREVLMKSTVIKGMLGDTHIFVFEPIGDNRTRLTQSVVFKGLMSPFIGGIVKDQQNGLDLMNETVKRKCEGTGSADPK